MASISTTSSPTSPCRRPSRPARRRPTRPVPAIVLDRDGRFVAAIGSPGGNAIIDYVAKALVAMIDWKMPIQEAISLPNIVARGASVSVETGARPEVIAALRAQGLTVQANAGEGSGLHGIVALPGAPN